MFDFNLGSHRVRAINVNAPARAAFFTFFFLGHVHLFDQQPLFLLSDFNGVMGSGTVEQGRG